MANKYNIVGLLGEGGFGKVFLIENEDTPDIKQALKLMEIGEMDEYTLKMTLQEIKLLQTLKHQNVLEYVDSFQHDGQICMITEYCPNGDLGDYIEQQQGKTLEKARLVEWFHQIASAIEYLHSKNIIHRDLKVQNVFLDANMDCKLGDFGIARVLDSVTDLAQTQIGTYHYMSPEMFMGIPYNVKTDIWSLAIVIYELARLEKPFNAFFLPSLIFKITRGEKPEMPYEYGEDFADLLSSMMEKNPNDRPTSADIMKHKLFRKVKKPNPMPNLKTTSVLRVEGFQSGVPNVDRILQTFCDMKQSGREQPVRKEQWKQMPPVDEPVRQEDSSNSAMDLVMRTLSSMGHNTSGGGQKGSKAHLKQQVEMLRVCYVALNSSGFSSAASVDTFMVLTAAR